MKKLNNLIIKEKINIMKNQFNSKMILALSLIAFYSCTTDDFLEKPPLNELSTEVSYASKNAIAKVEKNGGKVNLIKI